MIFEFHQKDNIHIYFPLPHVIGVVTSRNYEAMKYEHV